MSSVFFVIWVDLLVRLHQHQQQVLVVLDESGHQVHEARVQQQLQVWPDQVLVEQEEQQAQEECEHDLVQVLALIQQQE